MDLDDFSKLKNESRRFGHIPDVPEGAWFRTRKEVLNAGVHGLIRKGIHGDQVLGAFSIMLCGKYEDQDLGDTIIYTGSGGVDKVTGKPNASQSMGTFDNASLWMSKVRGQPVRVTRRGDRRSGYTYAGLYRVDSCYMKKGECGFELCFFELSKIVEDGIAGPSQSGEKARDAEDGFLPSGVNSSEEEENDDDELEEEEETIMRGDEEPKAE